MFCEFDLWFSGAATLSVMTFNLMTLSINGSFATLSINDSQHENTLYRVPLWWVLDFICTYAECRYAECRYAKCRGAIFPSLAIEISFQEKKIAVQHQPQIGGGGGGWVGGWDRLFCINSFELRPFWVQSHKKIYDRNLQVFVTS
jgi:hypothetical protein